MKPPSGTPTAAPTSSGPAPTSTSSNPLPPTGTGCAAHPSSCGYPDASNTGPRAGVALRAVPGQVSQGTGWHWDTRGWLEVDGNGAVLDGLTIPNNLNISASNVTVRNVRVIESGEGFGISLRHAQNVTIEDSEIFSPAGSTRLMVGIKDIYGDSYGTQILRTDIHNTSTGIQIDQGLIQDSYIHDMGYVAGDHINGITSNSGTTQLTIRHNTVFNQFDQTDAISLFEDFGIQANRLIDRNLVAGGGYTIYGGTGTKGATNNIKITNNRVARTLYPRGGYYGYLASFDPNGTGNLWSGNIWDEDGRALTG